jgi:hypothetical protein
VKHRNVAQTYELENYDGNSIFSATIWPVPRTRAAHTRAMPPMPTGRISS